MKFLRFATLSLLLLGVSKGFAAPGERFPLTKTRILSAANLADMTAADRRYAINEIYARHGLLFGDMALRKQFLKFSWYRPQPGQTMAQTKAKFNRIERQNVERLGLARDIERASTKADDYEDHVDVPDTDYVSLYAGTKKALPGERFAETRLVLLRDDAMANMSDAQIRYATNEIYARRGYLFQNMTLRKQFLGMSWYKPRAGRSMAQIRATMTRLERTNLETLASAGL